MTFAQLRYFPLGLRLRAAAHPPRKEKNRKAKNGNNNPTYQLKNRYMLLYFPPFSMRQIKKYAVKQRTVIVTERISCKSISTSCNPPPYYFGGVKNTQGASNKNNGFEKLRYFVLRLWHSVKHFFKNFLYAAKLFGNLVHISKDKGQGRSCQGSGLAFGGRPRLAGLSTVVDSGVLTSCSLAFRRRFLGETNPASSREPKAYMASLHTGFIPALCNICFTASLFLPELSASQRTVKKMFSVIFSPFMYMGLIHLLSSNFVKNFTSGNNLLNGCELPPFEWTQS